ncbi:MAG TPA: glycosyltransferase [Acidobacteriaceae bacterium]|jgi:glycosyltransferase involved in cell wall biosynthesis|nr:glycosyltransferase [Acidobacteriaceae bacterium]
MANANPPLSSAVLSQPRCVVVVPCYNEAARLDVETFARFLAAGRARTIHFLFVNDGSRDETLAVLESLRARFPERVSVLDQQPNRGKAEAVRNGMLEVIRSGAAVFTGYWDADLATPLEQIVDFLDLLELKPELNLVFGARVRLLGRAIHRQPLRHYLGRCFATVVSVLLRLPVYDTQCGAKLFRITPDLPEVLTEPFHSRWIFDVEILARLLALHRFNAVLLEGEIYEYPLPVWTDVAGSKVKPTDFLRAFGELAAIYRRHLAQRR